ncbi:sigma-70 family RNA polymerase sigma factor [Bacillus sp. V33-4]|uniref:sigma-70 family RNA polymerase sigma factor n=1 Tax=Bacillus sp. V33-4 TaxID=2054169 RepID=UPI000C775584|nr:sigma-70 family RNA polymerase sigma factor [Bacillus sp. V33-4]PLR87028.1 hypothetical protein CVD23_05195 [Bacillus sp. V33-4]
MEVSDQELVRRSAQGSYDAYAELVNRYSNLVYSIALNKIRDFQHSEDISQEVFVKAWSKIADMNEGDKFSAWISAITRNQCIDWFRKNSKEEVVYSENHNDVSTDFIKQHEIKITIWDALNRLDEKYRLVTILYFITGFRAKEISEQLNLTLSAVESRLRRAKEKLKEELFDLMAETFSEHKVGKEFEEEVMWRIIPRIATIEIPVSNVKTSIDWYNKILGTKVISETDNTAMLRLQGGNRVGVPTIYLVQTADSSRLSFKNTNTNITHSIIDFFIHDLNRFYTFLMEQGVIVTGINYIPGMPGFGGFGFLDPDGNSLSACNVTFSGQE